MSDAHVGLVVADVAFADFLGQLPAGDEHLAEIADVNALGGEPPVDDALGVRKGERVADAVEDGEEFLKIEGDDGA